MKKSRLAMIAIAACMLAAGCVQQSGIPSQTESDRIAVLENLKAQDVESITIGQGTNHDTLTDAYDIAVCLTDFQSIRLTEKTDETAGADYRSFLFCLADGNSVEVRVGSRFLDCGGGTYRFDTSGSPVTKGSVTLRTQGNACEPYAWWVYSQELYGLCADGTWFGAQALEYESGVEAELERLEEIPYADDFVFECVWDYDPEREIRPTYSVFDEDLYRISHYMPDLVIPDEKGLYYVSVNIGWGTVYRNAGYNYIFKIVRN